PKPGPPVVSTSTTREIPKALGLLHEVGMAEGHGAAGAAGARGGGAAAGGAAAPLLAAPSATRATRPRDRAPRGGVRGGAGGAAAKGRLFVREWRQRPPHTAQSPARTLLLPDACPTSNPKTQQPPRVAWTEFLYPTLVANSRRGHPLLALPKHRES